MTCIVGVIHNGKVTIGGDSAGVSGLDVTKRKDVKVFKNGDFVMGFTSSFRMGQLLHYSLNPPKIKRNQDIMEYMVNNFVPSVKQCLKDGGYGKSGGDGDRGGTFLVGFKGRLFRIDNDFQVGESYEDYDAVGCGESYAKGCLFGNSHLPPEDRIIQALSAAEYMSGGVMAPFVLETC